MLKGCNFHIHNNCICVFELEAAPAFLPGHFCSNVLLSEGNSRVSSLLGALQQWQGDGLSGFIAFTTSGRTDASAPPECVFFFKMNFGAVALSSPALLSVAAFPFSRCLRPHPSTPAARPRPLPPPPSYCDAVAPLNLQALPTALAVSLPAPPPETLPHHTLITEHTEGSILLCPALPAEVNAVGLASL